MSLDEAIADFPITTYLTQYVRNIRVGDEYIRGDCPVCGRRGSLSVNRQFKYFVCFKCRDTAEGEPLWSGKTNLVKMITVLEDISFREAFQRIYELSEIPEAPWEPRPTNKSTSLLPAGSQPLKYQSRTHTAKRFLESRGVPHLIDTSYVSLEEYRGRVILPCKFLGNLVGSECKTYYNQKPKSLYHPPQQIKTYSTVYTNNSYNVASDIAVVTESILDAETLHNVCNAIGLYGSQFKSGQLERLMQLGINRLYWALDADAWKKTKEAIAKWCLGMFENWVVPIPDGEDPNSLGTLKLIEQICQARKINTEWDLK